jgi:hypothetical protein
MGVNDLMPESQNGPTLNYTSANLITPLFYARVFYYSQLSTVLHLTSIFYFAIMCYMKIPSKIKVGGHIVKVELVDLGDNLDGDSSTTKNTIRIHKDLPDSQKAVTLIHEAFHMMNATWAETREGHIFLESLSQQLFQFLNDNKLLK